MLNGLLAVVACLALGLALVALLRLRTLRASLQDAQRRLYLAQARLNELEQTLQQELRTVRADIRRQLGGTRLDPKMTLAEAIAIDPRVRQVLAQFHLGGCSACAVDEADTIEHAAMSNGIDAVRFMAALDGLDDAQQPLQRSPGHGGLLQLTQFS